MMHRRNFLSLTSTGLLGAFSAKVIGTPFFEEQSSVTIHLDQELGRIDKKIYGHFLEHLEDIIYGGIYDPTSVHADKWGIRQDVVKAINDLGGAHVLRWPGGNFVSGYHWTDGIGPKEKRPKRLDLAFNQYDSNHFGTNEYLELCRQLRCEPFITVNMGSGTVEEACRWVEYCRRPDEKGKVKSPPVHIWGLGNEHFGRWQLGHYTPSEYARMVHQYAQFMRVVEPNLKFVGVGYNREGWNQTVLKEAGDWFDWLTIHLYTHRFHRDGVNDFDTTVASPVFFETEIELMKEHIEAYEKNSRRKEPLKICLEEWNTRHFDKHRIVRRSPRNITDALFVAGVYNVCQRQAGRVTMSNYIYLINSHAPITVHGNKIVRSATYDVYRLYATLAQPVSVAADVAAASFTVPSKDVAAGQPGQAEKMTARRLDVSATRSVDGKKLTLFLLNRHAATPLKVKLNGLNGFAPTATLHSLAADSLTAVNTVDQPDRIRAKKRNITNWQDGLELPSASFAVLELQKI